MMMLLLYLTSKELPYNILVLTKVLRQEKNKKRKKVLKILNRKDYRTGKERYFT